MICSRSIVRHVALLKTSIVESGLNAAGAAASACTWNKGPNGWTERTVMLTGSCASTYFASGLKARRVRSPLSGGWSVTRERMLGIDSARLEATPAMMFCRH